VSTANLVEVLIAVGSIVAIGIFGYVVKKATKSPIAALPPPPPNWGQSQDDIRWTKEASDILHTNLSNVRGAAEKWGASITALLGAFSAVALIKGPQTFSDIGRPWSTLAICLIAAASVVAVAAIYTAAIAAQGVPQQSQQINGWRLKEIHKTRSSFATRMLGLSRALAICAALLGGRCSPTSCRRSAR
jgi:hypothetical protein